MKHITQSTDPKLISKDEKIVVRMAPSPTGALHVGTARTALFNYLFAKHYNGKFILRVEDTDVERSAKKWEKDILEGLDWLGIQWDGKPEYQSKRKKVYKQYLEQMLKGGKAFYCWHTKDELLAEKQKQMSNKEAPRHNCEYRNKKTKDGATIKKSIIRFKNDNDGVIKFYDYVRGNVVFDAKIIGDFSIAKDLNNALYNFAVVIDDYEMKVSHIIRGEDHIPNTPKQIMLQNALGFNQPKFIHIPLLLGPDKSKLSKRHSATSLAEYKKLGYLPEALFNFLSLLGWHPKDDEKEIMIEQEIIKEFNVEGVQQSGAVFDIEKLNWMNGVYLRNKKIDEFVRLCLPYLVEAGFIKSKNTGYQTPILGQVTKERLTKILALEQERIKKLSDITEAVDYFFKEPEYSAELLVWKDMPLAELSEILLNLYDILDNIEEKNWNKEKLEKIIMPQAEMVGDRGKMLWPLRVALCGKKASPGPFEIAELLGKKPVLKRVKNAHNNIKKLINGG